MNHDFYCIAKFILILYAVLFFYLAIKERNNVLRFIDKDFVNVVSLLLFDLQKLLTNIGATKQAFVLFSKVTVAALTSAKGESIGYMRMRVAPSPSHSCANRGLCQ